MLFIANDPSISWEKFEVNYQKKCWSLALQGGNIKIKKTPTLLGAAVEYETFFKHLKVCFTNHGLVCSDIIIKDFISRLQEGRLSKNLGNLIRLKPYSVWATWNENDLSGLPFDYAKTNLADEIRANMGLKRDAVDLSPALLLFVYSSPSHIEAKRPTIADAELSEYFQPPPESFDQHGWTVVWQNEIRFKGYNIKQRPECIHDSILLSQLKLPVEIRP